MSGIRNVMEITFRILIGYGYLNDYHTKNGYEIISDQVLVLDNFCYGS